jgi:type I restriction enzyme S subunit
MIKLKIPEGWEDISVENVGISITGNTPSKKEKTNYGDYIPFVKPPELHNYWVKSAPDNLSQSGAQKARVLPPNSVLVSCIGNLGKVGISKIPVAFNQQINAIIPFSGINPLFLFYQAQSLFFRLQLEKLASATTISIVNKGNFEKLRIPLVPQPEQEQLVLVIEQLFSDLDNAIDNLKKAKDQLKVYRQSVLKYAFEGKYSGCKKTWKTEPIGEICKVVSGNTPKGVNDILTDGDIPFYKVADMNTEGNELFMKKAKINLSTSECKKLKLKTFPKGTVIFPKRGGAILTNKKRILSQESAFDLNLMGVIPGENVRERFLFDWFLALDLGTLYDGSNVPQINHSDIEPLKFPQVSIEIQDNVIKEVESRLSVCEKMEETINNSLEQAEALRQSILKQAFEGKLTEDWRKKHPDLISGENSAKALLERIKKEREALKNTKKRKK